jgi:hypothetical protein
MNCKEGPRSRFPSSIAFNAAWRALDDWVRRGIPAPHADPIRVENGKAVLDEFGNLQGGVRSPFVDVPTSTWFGSSTGESFCFIAGHENPIDPVHLKRIYPDHKTYEKQVISDVTKLVKARLITPQDGEELIAEAKRASIP